MDGTYQGMNPAPVVSWGVANGGNVVDISGSSVQGLKDEIVNGNPVVAWVTYAFEPAQHKSMFWGDAIWNRHVVAVDGFKDGFTMLSILCLGQVGLMQDHLKQHITYLN